MSVCPGNPDGHQWHFITEDRRGHWGHDLVRVGPLVALREKLFGPLTPSLTNVTRYVYDTVHRKWACSLCRTVEWTVEEI